MKKFKLLCLSLTILFGIQTVTPKANAVAAGVMAIVGTGGAATIAIIGAGMLGGGTLTFVGMGFTTGPNYNRPVVEFWAGLAAFLYTAGLFILPDNSGGVELTAINPEQSRFTGVTAENIQQYNSELPVINMAKQEVTASLISGELKSTKEIRAKWLSYKDAGVISETAFAVLEKVSDATAKQVAKSL